MVSSLRLRASSAAALCAATLTVAAAAASRQADWPQYRGPDRQGRIEAEGLLTSWGEGEPREVWRRAIGGGFSAPTVVGGRLFTMALAGDQESLLCLDAETGDELWSVTIGASGEAFPENGPRASPTVVDGIVYTVSSQGELAALTAEDGTLVWKRSLGETGPPPRFGYSVSPLVDGELVIVEAGKKDEEPGILALDRKTGEPRWGALEGPAGYSSPIVVEVGGVRQYVFFRRAAAEVVALSTAGELLWRHPTRGLAIIVTPIFLPPDRFFVATSDDGFGGLMLRVVREENGFRSEEVWSERLMRNHFNASVLVDGHLYGFDNATFRCLEAATGKRRWAYRGLGKGSLVAAGKLLFVLADDGTLVLAHASPEGYHEAGRVKAMTGRAWTAPSLAADRIYLRDFDEIVSYDLGSGGTRTAPGTSPAATAEATGRSVSPPPADLGVDEVVARYLAARGGAERWRQAQSLRFEGRYAAFSQDSAFELIRRRGNLYRLEYEMLGGPAIRARDAVGAWGQHALLKPQAGRIDEDPYKSQHERESLFEPPLLDFTEKGITVALAGAGEINGDPTIDLRLTFPGGKQEVWHLDPQTWLEVAVDSQVFDFTQLPEPMEQRTFFGDFREVGGLVLPFRVELEFGARLETMEVEKAEVDLELDTVRFDAPPAPPENSAGDSGV